MKKNLIHFSNIVELDFLILILINFSLFLRSLIQINLLENYKHFLEYLFHVYNLQRIPSRYKKLSLFPTFFFCFIIQRKNFSNYINWKLYVHLLLFTEFLSIYIKTFLPGALIKDRSKENVQFEYKNVLGSIKN